MPDEGDAGSLTKKRQEILDNAVMWFGTYELSKLDALSMEELKQLYARTVLDDRRKSRADLLGYISRRAKSAEDRGWALGVIARDFQELASLEKNIIHDLARVGADFSVWESFIKSALSVCGEAILSARRAFSSALGEMKKTMDPESLAHWSALFALPSISEEESARVITKIMELGDNVSDVHLCCAYVEGVDSKLQCWCEAFRVGIARLHELVKGKSTWSAINAIIYIAIRANSRREKFEAILALEEITASLSDWEGLYEEHQDTLTGEVLKILQDKLAEGFVFEIGQARNLEERIGLCKRLSKFNFLGPDLMERLLIDIEDSIALDVDIKKAYLLAIEYGLPAAENVLAERLRVNENTNFKFWLELFQKARDGWSIERPSRNEMIDIFFSKACVTSHKIEQKIILFANSESMPKKMLRIMQDIRNSEIIDSDSGLYEVIRSLEKDALRSPGWKRDLFGLLKVKMQSSIKLR